MSSKCFTLYDVLGVVSALFVGRFCVRLSSCPIYPLYILCFSSQLTAVKHKVDGTIIKELSERNSLESRRTLNGRSCEHSVFIGCGL